MSSASASGNTISNQTMRAVRIHQFGGPEQLRTDEVPVPAPGPNEALVKVAGAGVNPVDWKTRNSPAVVQGAELPLILGWDIAGRVVTVGAGVSGLAPEQPVYGLIRFPGVGSAYAEYATAPATELAPRPATLDDIAAAAVPLAGLTAWQALFDVARLREGETLLVNGASGGVGHLAAQLASARGARVLGTTSPRNIDFVRSLGVLAIDYTQPNAFAPYADSVDVVLDTVGGDAGEQLLPVLKRGGRYVTIAGGLPDENAATARGVTAQRYLVHPDGQELAEIGKLIDAGKVRVEVAAAVPFAEAARAHEMSQSGRTRGKIVLVP